LNVMGAAKLCAAGIKHPTEHERQFLVGILKKKVSRKED
jgi:disulfide oxidoreductase YuzD